MRSNPSFVLSGLLVAGLLFQTSDLAPSASSTPTANEQNIEVLAQRGRRRVWRGSGRREILAVQPMAEPTIL